MGNAFPTPYRQMIREERLQMFSEWANENDMMTLLKSAGEFAPYPKWSDRASWEGVDAVLRREKIAAAQILLGQEWPSLPATAFLDYYRTGGRVAYENPHFTRRRALIDLVLGECLEGRGRFVNDIVNGIWAICEESFWGVSAHNGTLASSAIDRCKRTPPLPDVENCYIDLFAAETAALLTWTAYLLREKLDEVSAQICRRIAIELERRIKTPFLTHIDFGWMGYSRKTNNWNPWIISNIMSVFLLEEPDERRREAAFLKMFECLDHFMALYGPDGGCDEGTSYWNRAGGMLYDNLSLLHKISGGTIDFFADELVRQIGRFMYREHIAGPYYVNFSDGAAIARISPELMYRYGKRIGDQRLMDLGVSAQAVEPDITKHNNSVTDNLRRWLDNFFDTDGFLAQRRTGAAKPPFVRETWLETIEVMTAREREGDCKGLYLAAKGGHNDENHNHNDVGTVIVYVDGKPALIDAGVGVYTRKTFSPERYTIWTMQSGYHNLPTVNGIQQKDGRQYRAANADCRMDASAAALSVELQDAYPREAGLSRYRRTSTLSRDGKASVTVRDDYVFTSDGNTVELSLMLWKEPHISGHSLTVAIDDETIFRIDFAPSFSARVEKLELDDTRLQAVWGECVYRVLLSAGAVGQEMSSTVTITQN